MLIILAFPVLSAPPFESQDSLSGLNILHPIQTSIKQGTTFSLHFHVFDANNTLMTGDSVNCSLHLYSPLNSHILRQNLTVDLQDYEATIDASLITEKGLYQYNIWCFENQYVGGYSSGGFYVSSSGFWEDSRYLPLIIAICLTAFLYLYFAFKLDKSHFLLQVLLIFFSLINLSILPSVLMSGVDIVVLRHFRIITAFFGVFVIYISIYLFYHWFNKSQRVIDTINRFKRE